MSLRFRTLPGLAAFVVMSACGSGAVPEVDMGMATALRFEERWVVTDDSVHLYARVVGVGPDTVLIPGGGYLARDFDALAVGRTLIFFDPRSRGASDAVFDTLRLGIDREVRDLEAVRTAFGVDRVSVIGWSYLGAVVALYAAEYPDHVRSVVQIGPMGPRPLSLPEGARRGTPPDSADLRQLADLERAGLPVTDPVRYCRAWVRIQMTGLMGRPEGVARFKGDPCLYWNEWPAQLNATIRRTPSRSDRDYTAQAARIRVPVLTVHGTADPNAPVEGGREWAALVPNARLLELDGVGHAPWLEAPEEFFPAVDAFLREGTR